MYHFLPTTLKSDCIYRKSTFPCVTFSIYQDPQKPSSALRISQNRQITFFIFTNHVTSL